MIVAGGIVRNRAWILPRHLEAVTLNGPARLFYVTGDNDDDTVGKLRDWQYDEFTEGGPEKLRYHLHDTGFPGWHRSGEPRYSSENMAPLRNLWGEEAVRRWPQLTHLWVVDSDVLPAADVLSRLLALNRPIAGAWVPGCTPCEGWSYERGRAVRSHWEERRGEPFRATMLGGCYLIRRDAWDAGLRWSPHPQGEDGGFGDSARKLGLEMWADPLARCEHVMEEPKEKEGIE